MLYTRLSIHPAIIITPTPRSLLTSIVASVSVFRVAHPSSPTPRVLGFLPMVWCPRLLTISQCPSGLLFAQTPAPCSPFLHSLTLATYLKPLQQPVFACVYSLYMCLCVYFYRIYAASLGDRRGFWTLWNWSYGQLCYQIWVLFRSSMHPLFFFSFFQDTVSLYSPSCPRPHFVDQSSLKLRFSCLCPQCWIKKHGPHTGGAVCTLNCWAVSLAPTASFT